MTSDDLAHDLLAAPWFAELVHSITVRSVYNDLTAITPLVAPKPVPWTVALRGASTLTTAVHEPAQDAALRVAQGCLSDPMANDVQRTAAAVLLERLGNRRALELATHASLSAGKCGLLLRRPCN